MRWCSTAKLFRLFVLYAPKHKKTPFTLPEIEPGSPKWEPVLLFIRPNARRPV
uniref:Uncharacterized protein n=1 Tax=Arion vulgaris TaxID=1028688 RepID=A0A0B7B539_9EUPU